MLGTTMAEDEREMVVVVDDEEEAIAIAARRGCHAAISEMTKGY